MFYLSLTVLVWAAAILFLDWGRLRQLLPIGLAGAFLSSSMDFTGGILLGWWQYSDTQWLRTHAAISGLIHIGAAPLVAMFFAQGVPPRSPLPVARIALYTALSMAPEVAASYIGRIHYRAPWGLSVSAVAYLIMWTGLWALQRWWHLERLGQKQPER
jgi:hypothetical protein